MTAYLDGALDETDRERLEGHLAGCPHCTEYLSQLRVTVEALGRVSTDDLSDEAIDELVDVYRRWRNG